MKSFKRPPPPCDFFSLKKYSFFFKRLLPLSAFESISFLPFVNNLSPSIIHSQRQSQAFVSLLHILKYLFRIRCNKSPEKNSSQLNYCQLLKKKKSERDCSGFGGLLETCLLNVRGIIFDFVQRCQKEKVQNQKKRKEKFTLLCVPTKMWGQI